MSQNRFPTLLARSLRLRCPLCGRGKLFQSWFRMHACCTVCGTRFEREAGFFLGSIYFNYGLTALAVAIVYPILVFKQILPSHQALGIALAFTIIFPMLFFPFARSLWLGFDEYWDPRGADPLAHREAVDEHEPGSDDYEE